MSRATAPAPSSARPAPDAFSRSCPSRTLVADVAGKWGVLLLVGLLPGPMRFGELRRRVDGVSEKMLSQTLQVLERDGFVVRDVRSTIPPHVRYELTPLGRGLADRLVGLVDFLQGSLDTVLEARTAFDARPPAR